MAIHTAAMRDVCMSMEDKARFGRDGFILVRGVFAPDEIHDLRRSIVRHFDALGHPFDGGFTQPDAFRKIPETRWVLGHPNVRKVFTFFCGSDLCYCHHSDAHFNKFTGWHKDNCGPDDFDADGGEGCYGVYKMGIYLQDHAAGPPALTVRAGSHQQPALKCGQAIALQPSLGDIVLFDCRISHKGMEMYLFQKVVNRLIADNALKTRIMQPLWKLRAAQKKICFFFTLGRPNRFLDQHVATTLPRQLRQIGESEYNLPAELRTQVLAGGWGIARIPVEYGAV